MAETLIIEIGINDSLQDVIRKCNNNFRRVSVNQSQNTNSKIRIESSRTDAAIEGAIGEINTAIDEAKKDLDKKAEQLSKDIEDKLTAAEEQLKKDLEAKAKEIEIKTIPPINTCIIASYNPNTQWPGTTWVQVSTNIEMDSALLLWRRTK